MIGLALIAVVLVAAIIGAVAVPESANRSVLGQRLNPPERRARLRHRRLRPRHPPAGADGSAASLAVGVISIAIGSVLGLAQGLVGRLPRRAGQRDIMRFTDAMLAFPALLLALAVMATLGAGLSNIMIADRALLDAALHPADARRGADDQEPRVRHGGARRSGRAPPASCSQHILPNALSSMLVLSTLSISTAILAEATLSFLGLGPRPPTATWGSMISDGTSVLEVAPWVVLFPGLAITVTVLGFSLFGDGLRDALDVRLRDR